MRRLLPRSLAARLVVALALTQSLVVLAGMAAWMLGSNAVSWEDVASESAAAQVLAALGQAEHAVAVLPGGALAAYAARRPSLRWAVLAEGRVLDGAAPDLAAALAALGPVLPREGRLAVALPDGASAAFRPADTPFGPVVVVTAGNRFHAADDLGTFFSDYAVQLVPLFGPALLAAAIAMPLAVRRILRPVRDAARAAETIGLSSLDRRLDEAAAPSELRPLLGATNRLLGRIDDGVQRQRIFTANAAHELRTPVAILQARIDALSDDVPHRTELARDVRRVTRLLDQLLAVARLGQRDAEPGEAVDLARLAREVAAEMAPLAIRAGRAIAVEAEAPAAVLHGHARALESAVANLVDNALRAEPPGGTVTIAVGRGGRLAVVDHGPGLAAADKPLVFEPFWRKDETTRGSGLGLAIVREVARLHGGQAHAEDTPGGGATFVLDLPAAAGGVRRP